MASGSNYYGVGERFRNMPHRKGVRVEKKNSPLLAAENAYRIFGKQCQGVKLHRLIIQAFKFKR